MEIVISRRLYNGDVGPGNVLENKYVFNLEDEKSFWGTKASITTKAQIMLSDKIDDIEEFESIIQMTLSNRKLSVLNKIIETIKSSDDFIYSEEHYSKEKFDINKYAYDDVKINDVMYEIKYNEKILKKLKKIIKCDISEKQFWKMHKSK